ncbi:MAG: SEC-C metal-binding domain-containing protein [Acidobacteriota bacterium]
MTEHTAKHPGRNEPCPCGSGKKYKRCCLAKDEAMEREARAEAAAAAAKSLPKESAAKEHPQPHPPRDQPWKRSTRDNRPMQRFNTPRKRGDG